jgi:charged multivesicular body protein 1
MGTNHSKQLEDTIFEMRLASKQFVKESQRCEREEKQEKEKARKKLEQGLIDIARIHAENAIRKKNESLNYMRLASKMDAVTTRIQSAHRTETITGNLAKAVSQMDRTLKNMKPENIAQTMTNFEKSFEDIDVATGYINESLNQATSVSAPREQVDHLLGEIASVNNIEVSEQLLSPGTGIGVNLGVEEQKSNVERQNR